jgi:uncharacterized protein (TIGR00255 family)
MTAFARSQADQVTWEIRAVNQRYLDLSFRMPDNFRELEPELRNMLRDKVHRGKVDCALRMDGIAEGMNEPELDESKLEHLIRLVDHVASRNNNLSPVNPLELLKWPGVLVEPQSEMEDLLARVKQAFGGAITSLVSMREREGAELERLITERLDELTTIVSGIRDQAPQIVDNLSTRIREKIAELGTEIDTGRLEQELVYLSQRADVQEELDRLDTHVEEVRTTLAKQGPIGRRLDFLMQELNREANTLSSKSLAADVSIQAVELKVIIEQMREQVQNIE